MDNYFLGVDVGTGSVRAAVVNKKGSIIASASHPIQTWNPEHDYYEQSSEDIWHSVCKSVHSALEKSGVDRAKIRGIGFDATCSL